MSIVVGGNGGFFTAQTYFLDNTASINNTTTLTLQAPVDKKVRLGLCTIGVTGPVTITVDDVVLISGTMRLFTDTGGGLVTGYFVSQAGGGTTQGTSLISIQDVVSKVGGKIVVSTTLASPNTALSYRYEYGV